MSSQHLQQRMYAIPQAQQLRSGTPHSPRMDAHSNRPTTTSMTMSQITIHSSREVCALLLWSRSLRGGGGGGKWGAAAVWMACTAALPLRSPQAWPLPPPLPQPPL